MSHSRNKSSKANGMTNGASKDMSVSPDPHHRHFANLSITVRSMSSSLVLAPLVLVRPLARNPSIYQS